MRLIYTDVLPDSICVQWWPYWERFSVKMEGKISYKSTPLRSDYVIKEFKTKWIFDSARMDGGKDVDVG